MQTDFEVMGGMVDFQFLRIFPLKNRCIVFFAGKNTPTETKNAFFGKWFPKKAILAEVDSFQSDIDFFSEQSLEDAGALCVLQEFQRNL